MATELYQRDIMEKSICCRGETRRVSGKKIQDAHEAIRPTDITRLPAAVKDSLIQRPVPSLSADLETVYCQLAWQMQNTTPWQ